MKHAKRFKKISKQLKGSAKTHAGQEKLDKLAGKYMEKSIRICSYYSCLDDVLFLYHAAVNRLYSDLFSKPQYHQERKQP